MITVIKPGLLSTIQDMGRWGYQAYGMPVAGAMDRYACRVANLLAGNEKNAAVIEMTMLGAALRFEEDTWIALCGADMQVTVNGAPVRNWSSCYVGAGSELVCGYAVSGCRAYLAVHGGIDVPLVLGSRSTYTRGGIGGADGKALQAGTVLKTGAATAKFDRARALPGKYIPDYGSSWTVRVMLGPQDDSFTEEGICVLFDSEYTVSPEADRMGYRMEGAKIAHTGKADIISDALCQGAIQVPGHGMPIVMMADRQTTGGYTKIGTVIGPDLMLLAQAKPGDQVRFSRCSDAQAVEAFMEEEARYEAVAAYLKEVPVPDGKPLKITVNGMAYYVEIKEVK